MKALIVDDEIEIGLILSKMLRKEGLIAKNLTRINLAKDEIKESSYDLFFLDLNLPDGTGFDLIPIIREVNPKAKIFIISAYDGMIESKRAREMKVDDFIKKPFTKAEIFEALNNK